MTDLDDGWSVVAMIDQDGRLVGEGLGPISPDEREALVRELLAYRPPAPQGWGAATRLEALTGISVDVLRLERGLRRVASEDEAPRVDEALADLRALLRVLVSSENAGG